ncbi:hypothetical protein AJ78_05385 [Emergomyces pasteurianus Ep9510]|uniref:Phosphatidic acid phosphatase type 2/haloperoxidase domain-containing protein n=1 Tax=Emergomyces pasteurianus Ep9510 TaxID=1447872 RepID=A0A1J9PCH7_9EURO|nr:hypothetical protein AJ78_05385 [Emergomyces pasteurianus Ep9510]
MAFFPNLPRDMPVCREWRFSKRLILSYVVDWILILATTAVGAVMAHIEPNRHAFSLSDPSISYPHVHSTISTKISLIATLVVPAVVIFLVSIFFIPGCTAGKQAPKALIWQRKAWEWNVGWMGLGISYIGVNACTEALKVIFGKPRPDLLSRCKPDLSNIAPHVVGGLGKKLQGAPLLVTYTICKNTSPKLTREGFVSFPSGHASASFAGLTYLSLWLCAKFSISIPYLAPRPYTQDIRQTVFLAADNNRNNNDNNNNNNHTTDKSSSPLDAPNTSSSHYNESTSEPNNIVQIRKESAAAPIYLLILACAPIAGAGYITATRWVNNRHHPFDIIFGSLLGILFGWLGFRWYHPPLTSSAAGWAWGARSPERAFFAGVGVNGYVWHDLENVSERAASSSSRPQIHSTVVQKGENNV